MKYKITKNGKSGHIRYDATTQTAEIMFPSIADVSAINDFLNTPQVFRYPVGPGIDEDEEIVAKPLDNPGLFEEALGTLWSKTGVKVVW